MIMNSDQIGVCDRDGTGVSVFVLGMIRTDFMYRAAICTLIYLMVKHAVRR